MSEKKEYHPSQAELNIQNNYIFKINERLKDTNKTYYTVTFGCQMNARDSEKLSGMLHAMGYAKADKEHNADFIIYNTCCVRENAEKKVYGKLGYLKALKKQKPNLKIAVCGCMMQEDHVLNTIKTSYKHVDIVFGTFNLYKFPELYYSHLTSKDMVIDIWDSHKDIVEDLPSIREYPYKVGVNIMYGCNNFCSYCIVPYVRGRERSRHKDDILAEIENLANDNVVEIMLLGQNVNSYGKDLDEDITFAELLREINKINGIKRIRFMTSHPKDLSDDLIYAMRDCDKVCKCLHLPFQSGSTRVLDLMNRKYTKERYLEIIEKARKEMPDIFITTDIIVGFPGETEEDFLNTLDVVEKVRFSGCFTFIYSKRTGTPAALMDEQIPEDVVKERFNRLLDVSNGIIYEISSSLVGNIESVLAESLSKEDDNLLTGRTERNSIVHFKGDKSLIGQIVDVKIIDNKTFYLIGECI